MIIIQQFLMWIRNLFISHGKCWNRGTCSFLLRDRIKRRSEKINPSYLAYDDRYPCFRCGYWVRGWEHFKDDEYGCGINKDGQYGSANYSQLIQLDRGKIE